MKLRKGQHLLTAGAEYEYVCSFESKCAFWLTRIRERLQQPVKTAPKTFIAPPVLVSCNDIALNAGRYLLLKITKQNNPVTAGKLFRIEGFAAQPLRAACVYKTKSAHCLSVVRMAGSRDKKDMVSQVSPVIQKGQYLVVRIVGK